MCGDIVNPQPLCCHIVDILPLGPMVPWALGPWPRAWGSVLWSWALGPVQRALAVGQSNGPGPWARSNGLAVEGIN